MRYITTFVLPSHPEFRKWKFRTDKGVWIDITNRIKTKIQMDKLLDKINPYEVYFSTCLWQGGRFLFAPEIVFDIDCKSSIKKAANYGIKLIKHMNAQHQAKLLQIHFTGQKGFRLIYKDNIRDEYVGPEQRMNRFTLRRKELLKSLPKSITLDEDVTSQSEQVIRMVGSLHLKTGRKCIMIPKKTFLFNPNELKAMTGGVSKTLTPTINTVGNRGGLRLSTPFYYFNMSNRINGVKDKYVPLILRKKAQYYETSIIDIIKTYNLKQVLAFETHDMNVYLCLKPVSYRRCKKILSQADSLNYNKFSKEGQCFWRLSPFINKEKDMDSNPIFRKCIGEEKYDIISLPHHYALTHYFHLPYINDCTFIGNLNKVAKIEITD